MEKLQWFKFSPTDWSMGKIQRCPEITQARYIRLCCLYWNKEANLSYEDAEIDIDKEHLDILVSKKIVECIDDNVVIKFLDEQLVDITANSKSKSKAAKARWDKYKSKEVQSTTNADAMHVHTDAMQNDAEKRREEETREEKRREEKQKSDLFDTFWNLYGKKEDRKKSFTKWMNLKIETMETIIEVVPKYVKQKPDIKYRKNPVTFLNNRSWEDEIIAEKEKPQKVPMQKAVL